MSASSCHGETLHPFAVFILTVELTPTWPLTVKHPMTHTHTHWESQNFLIPMWVWVPIALPTYIIKEYKNSLQTNGQIISSG
jgi:hypothetical protein